MTARVFLDRIRQNGHVSFDGDLVVAAFGKAVEFDGQSTELLGHIAGSRSACYQINRLLLEQGDHICSRIHEDVYSKLIEAIEGQIGFGKGVFTATLMHMPERYARMKLAIWRKGEKVSDVITTHLRQSVLSNALAGGRHHLAHDISSWMTSLKEELYIRKALVAFDRDAIVQSNFESYLPESAHVSFLCNDQAYMQAFSVCTNEASIEIVRQAMSKELGATDSSWSGLLSAVSSRLGDEYDADTVQDRFRAIGSVLVLHLRQMTPEMRKQQLSDDDLRIMAFKCGVRDTIAEIKSASHKREAMMFDLAL